MNGCEFPCNKILCNKCKCMLRRASISIYAKKKAPSTVRLVTTFKTVEQLRHEMIRLVFEKGSFTHPDVIQASQRLDTILVQVQCGYRKSVFAVRQSFHSRMEKNIHASH